MKITNNSQSPQGVQTLSGLVYVKPGQSRDVELDAMQAERARRIDGLVLEGDASDAGPDVGRNAEGDGPEAAQLRRMFDASWEQARQKAGATDGESLTDAIARLMAGAEASNTFAIELREALVLDKDGDILGGIASLKGRIAELELENEELKKGAGTVQKLEAKHRGGGSYSVLDADGKEVVEKLDKDAAEKFNALSDEDKAKFVAEKSKAA